MLRVAFAGTPEFALPALTVLEAQHELVGVLTQPDRPRGRGRRLTPSAVKVAAAAWQLPVMQPHTLRSEAALAELTAWRPDVLVVVAYGVLLPHEVLTLPRLGCVNIHASLLPRWRGAAPIERAMLAGDPETGVSIMQMDAGLDTGPLLLQRTVRVRSDHTGGTLRTELAALGAAALLEALSGLEAGTLRARPQPQAGVTYAARIVKAEAHIDWTRDAAAIERQVRAFNPRPVAETILDGEQLRIFAGHVTTEGASSSGGNWVESEGKRREPGTIIAVGDGYMLVQCGLGCLAVTEVQRPGRRVVSTRDFAHGRALTGGHLG